MEDNLSQWIFHSQNFQLCQNIYRNWILSSINIFFFVEPNAHHQQAGLHDGKNLDFISIPDRGRSWRVYSNQYLQAYHSWNSIPGLSIKFEGIQPVFVFYQIHMGPHYILTMVSFWKYWYGSCWLDKSNLYGLSCSTLGISSLDEDTPDFHGQKFHFHICDRKRVFQYRPYNGR